MNAGKSSRSIVVRAEKKLITSQDDTEKRYRYRNPSISIEQRNLGPLKTRDIRVELLYAGICGTDSHLLQTDKDSLSLSSAPIDIPLNGRIIGHEGVGKVVGVGSDVSGFKVGDTVGLQSIMTCFNCEPCRRGQFNQCVNAKLIGMQIDGLFSEYADFPESAAYNLNKLYALYRNEDALKAAACLEPAGVSWLACDQTSISSGDKVLIFGGGPIGYFCAMFSKLLFGCSWVGLVEPLEFRRNHAKKWCDEVFDSVDGNLKSRNFDIVIEASGYLKNIAAVMTHINPLGRVALLGRSGESLHLENIDHIITNAIKIIGVRGHLGGAFGRIIDLYIAGKIPLHEAVTEVISSIDELHLKLLNPDGVSMHNCKILAKISQ
jgi:threonine dehydrogenase-like Zn-dependent dehydrogenase